MAVIDGKWLSKECFTYFWSKIKVIFTKQTETNVVANLGAKNLLLVTGTTGTVPKLSTRAVTYTVNDDGTITANGQPSANADWNVNSSFHLEPGTYKLTGCPAGGNNSSTYKLQIQGIGYDTGDGLTFTVASATNVNVYIRVWSGYNASNLVFKPMIRRAEITDDTFQPYAPTNRELYETKTEQTETNVIANLGAKNLLASDGIGYSSSQGKTRVTRGVTFTLNDDGSVSCSGTNDGTGVSRCRLCIGGSLSYITEYCNGLYILSGCPSGGSSQKWYMSAYGNGSPAYSVNDFGDGVILPTPSSSNYNIVVEMVIASGQDASGLVFYPMVHRAEITDTTFQPYAPTNRELYETRFASKTILPNDVDLNDIKTGGIYNGVTSTGNSAVHMPVANGSFYFVLTVIELNESIIQIFKQLNSAGDPNLYIRRFFIYNSDWDAWYQFTGTQV